MKQLIVFAFLLLSVTTSFSQESNGIASYTVPAGWQSAKKGSTVTLSRLQTKGSSVCRIIIHGTESVVVNSSELHQQWRGTKNTSNGNFEGSKRITRKEANGFITMMSAGTATIDGKQVSVYFYSYTNNQQSFFIELQAETKSCTEAFSQFQNSLQIDEAAEEGATNNKAKQSTGRKKAAPAAVPAAPAPMM